MPRLRKVCLLLVSGLLLSRFGSAQTANEKADANKLAQELAHPVANLWSLQFQFNNFELTNDRWNSNLNFQPVMPVSLTSCLNLITRPVIQVYNSAPYQTSTGADARTTNFGNWTQLELLSPVGTGDWLLGAGPTFIFPTGGSVYTSQGKFQVGPALVVAYMTKKYILGVFPQQWWSYAGDASRPDTNQMNFSPSSTSSSRAAGTSATRGTSWPTGRRLRTIVGPCPSASASAKWSSSVDCPSRYRSPASTWSRSPSLSVRSGTSRSSSRRCCRSSSRERCSSELGDLPGETFRLTSDPLGRDRENWSGRGVRSLVGGSRIGV